MEYDEQGLYIEDADIAAYAENLARGLHPDGRSRPAAEVQRLKAAMRTVTAARNEMHRSGAKDRAAEWILDNHYLARREMQAAAHALAASQPVPFCGDRARMALLCESLVKSGRKCIDEGRVLAFLEGAQRVGALEQSELDLLGACLRAALMGELAQACRDGDGAERMSVIFSSLRYLADAPIAQTAERANLVERTLRLDPSGTYAKMDEGSRAQYRAQVTRLAARAGMTETRAAGIAVELAAHAEGARSHVGWWLFREELGKRTQSGAGAAYISFIVLTAAFLSVLAGFASGSVLTAALLALPAWELAKNIADCAVLRMAAPRRLPRLELENGIPDEGKTLCAVSAILPDGGTAQRLADRLEENALLSRDCGRNLVFALLADLPESESEEYPDAEEILSAARRAIEELNARYGGGFCLLTRPRVPFDGRWMGRERKRGAVEDAMLYLRGEESGTVCAAGDETVLQNVRFLLCLDSDTRVTPGSVRMLVGAMLHPLCRPETDEKRGVVCEGNGMLSPRMAVELESARRSDFARIFGGQGGLEPYDGVCGETYMNLWGTGGGTGKSIIDIDCYLACIPGHIPQGRVLSHDTLENAFLRGGGMGDVVFLDDFPQTPASYYRRLHRWTRGDWQNSPWLFRRGRDLPENEKFRIFDSLRRSLTGASALAAICAGFFRADMAAAAVAALWVCLSELFMSAARELLRRDASAPRFHTAFYGGFGGAIVRAWLRLLLLPTEAMTCLDAALRALFRMASGRRLLEWQTASQSDGTHEILPWAWGAAVLGLALCIWSPSVAGRAAGTLWILSPACMWLLGLPCAGKTEISDGGTEYLMGCAADIWRYFDTFLTPENNWLPPDNFQQSPPAGLARRTSPTNIGLALISCAATAELGLATRERAGMLIESMLKTLRHLKKWRGHLLNWYDTATLAPLGPEYVSTVDSGNLYACLTALSAAMRSWGRGDLAESALFLAEEMDFSPLYDARRGLFYTGLEPQGEKTSKSHYDLLASEARLAAYAVIAKGDVPFRLWRSMSRAQVQKNGYRGMASWTGTMFEYLMPELFLPLIGGSLIYESARFCVYAQKCRTRAENAPWGESESAYAALDASMSYRYKAHGCAALALRRGMDAELVVSPYSSFLALCVTPNSAVENLRRLEKLGMRGDFGFWEALDYTRRSAQRSPSRVRCVMAHHLGMSMAAIANCVMNGLVNRWLFTDARMRAYSLLLQEQLPAGAEVLRRRTLDDEPPERERTVPDWEKRGSGTDFYRPECCLLAGMSLGTLVTEYGGVTARCGEISPYVPFLGFGRGGGVSFSAVTELGETQLLPQPGGEGAFSWRFTTAAAEISGDFGEFSSVCRFETAHTDAAEVYTVTLSHRSPGGNAGISMSLTPLLARLDDYRAHPAYWKLGLSAREKNGCLIVRRLTRGSLDERFLAVACSAPCRFENTPGADTGRALPPVQTGEDELFMTEPRIRCMAQPGDDGRVSFAVSMSLTAEDAVRSAQRLLQEPDERGDMPRRAAAVLGMGQPELERAFSMLPELFLGSAPLTGGDVRRGEIWKFGISGDLPIICAEVSGGFDGESVRDLMNAHLLLCACGFDTDLVFITDDAPGYTHPMADAVGETILRNGGELLSGARGGVHLAENAAGTDGVRSCASVRVDLKRGWEPAPRRAGEQMPPTPRLPAQMPEYEWRDGWFTFSANDALPPRVWSVILTNGRLSFIAADSGCGNMWYENARENPVSPWYGEGMAAAGPERLRLAAANGEISLFAGDGEWRVGFRPGCCVWEKSLGSEEVRVTAFIPPDTDARVLLIEGAGALRLRWDMELSLSPDADGGRYVETHEHGGMLFAVNRRGGENAHAAAACWPPASGFTCSAQSAARERYDCAAGAFSRSAFAFTLEARNAAVIVCGCCGESEMRKLLKPDAARAALRRTLGFWNRASGRFSLHSPDAALDNIMNGWIFYQTLACRLLARGSVYQNGGAFGFRDQLQDAVNLMLFDAEPAREQILRSCAHQYLEGDVQHWWHEDGGSSRGVRTRCSDDLIWLPWAVCEYLDATGDDAILRETVPFLHSAPLAAGERDRYEPSCASVKTGTVFDHCLLALQAVLRRGSGKHGLLFIGSGDWNDGFDRVLGESEWLTWFFCMTAVRFSRLMDRLCPGSGAELAQKAEELRRSAEKAWDGQWFLRGYYSSGAPLGSRECRECRIDSIAQSFAAFCPGNDPERVRTALQSAVRELFDRKNGVVRLFTPPFSGQSRPGYIESYGPGFRENGGQYTHGAVWLASALLKTGQTERGWEVLRALLPGEKDAQTYLGEPFVIAADVYSAPCHEGEAGWTWYTGSAGWLLRVVTEDLLGIRLCRGRLIIEPRLPKDWPGCTVTVRSHRVKIAKEGITVDGEPYSGGRI